MLISEIGKRGYGFMRMGFVGLSDGHDGCFWGRRADSFSAGDNLPLPSRMSGGSKEVRVVMEDLGVNGPVPNYRVRGG